MTYRGERKASNWQYPASVARVQATACARVAAMASSWSRPLSLTTFATSPNSTIASAKARMYRRLRFGGMESNIALPCSASNVNSTDGGGISDTVEGGKHTARSGTTRLPDDSPRWGTIIGARNGSACNRKTAAAATRRRGTPQQFTGNAHGLACC